MKHLPFSSNAEILEYSKTIPTPFYLYDAETIRSRCTLLKEAFEWADGFQNFFAVKATPNPHILKLIKEEGFGVDCSSYAELLLAESVGFKNEEIFFTSNNSTIGDYQKAVDLSAIINLDNISHLDFLYENALLPEHICFRYNPGSSIASVFKGNSIIGNPSESKFGVTKEQLFSGYKKAQAFGCKRFSLHTMLVSNCLDLEVFAQIAKFMFELVKEIKETLDIQIHRLNLGGGIGIPYKPDQTPINFKESPHFRNIVALYNAMRSNGDFGPDPFKLSLECGRFITGPGGLLVTRIINMKKTYKNYLGVDASIANLLRPAMYEEAYHHITHIGNSESGGSNNLFHADDGVFDVVGSLCENNDKLAKDRQFIGHKVVIGDLLVVHDTGAHSSAMGFNYNGKLQCAEYLRLSKSPPCHPSASNLKLIRRAQTYSDLFGTLSVENL